MQMLMHSKAEANWVIYLFYLKSGKICAAALTAVFLKTNHLKQRTGLDICRECVGLKIPPSFQPRPSHHTLTDPNSPETKNISSSSKLGCHLRPADLVDFDCQLHLFSPTGCWLRCLVLLFSQSIITGSRKVAFKTHLCSSCRGLSFLCPRWSACQMEPWQLLA